MTATATRVAVGDRIRCGDVVQVASQHRGYERWLVAYADYEVGRLAWFGWPAGEIDIQDCMLAEQCSDDEHAKAVAEWLDKPHGRDDYGCPDRRVYHVRRLYRPEEHLAIIRQQRAKRIAELERQLAALHAEALADPS